MKKYLYRGVSVIDDANNNGQLLPKGKSQTANVQYGQKGACMGAGYVYGESIGNAVRAHQVETGQNDTCYVSTSKDKNVAIRFATSGNIESGYLYTLDPKLFDKFNVLSVELSGSDETGEYEVSICTKDNGPIPKGVIVSKKLISIT